MDSSGLQHQLKCRIYSGIFKDTLSSDMLVLDMDSYDAILCYDWLKLHSPMECDWNLKTLEFSLQGHK